MPIEFCQICHKGLGSLSQAQLAFNLAAHVSTHLRAARDGPEKRRIEAYFGEIEQRFGSDAKLSVPVRGLDK